MSRTVSARVNNRTHDELRERCNKLGCNINEYVAEAIQFALTGSSDFDFDEEHKESPKEESKSKQVPKVVLMD